MKLEELLTKLPEDAKSKIEGCKDVESLLAVFKENGITINEEDLTSLIGGKNGELSDDELSNVTGGIDVSYLIQELIKFLVKKVKDN